ncbi:MAG: AmmeMemoRadiSam system protein B [Gemmatimonadetes bacterium]|nr:AmmeMemoRadiSam system protein B [Gemmatimonadota bacterium]
MPTTRPPAVAGTFYPDAAAVLEREVGEMLAHPKGPALAGAPKALIVPHAGYIYSGPIAASAYARLAPLRGRVRRVVLLGPAHFVAVRGLALPKAEAFETPLGVIPLDTAMMARLDALPPVSRSVAAHAPEHSLEVQLPFLQRVLGDFLLVPLVVGDTDADEVAAVLEAAWGGDETLIVISSDLSHYLTDERARVADRRTVDDILSLREVGHRQACGATPVNGLLVAARRRGLQPVALDVRNSSQTAGDPDRVVGYASFAFVEAEEEADEPLVDETEPSEDEKGAVLLHLARSAIGAELGLGPRASADAAWLSAPGATFVTLTKKGKLCGCIGSIEPRRSLSADVEENAVASAFHDPRFRPLRRAEFETVRVEVSLLSPMEPIEFADERGAVASLRPHVDGIVFAYGRYRSVYLPQVWEQLSKPAEFLANLKEKAGLPATFWATGVQLSRFTVSKWHEPAR